MCLVFFYVAKAPNKIVMPMITIKKGLDLPIAGTPDTTNVEHKLTQHVAVIGGDYVGMKPTMKVAEGDQVVKGQPLFADKKNAGVMFTAPASGKVVAINRGERRVFESLVIETDLNATDVNEINFNSYTNEQLASLERDAVVKQLVESGEWTALRTRPFSKVPAIDSTPVAIFVTAMDTNPLAFDPMLIIKPEQQSFNEGLAVLSKLAPKLYVCHAANAGIDKTSTHNVSYHVFTGMHPAGLVGTHIHFLEPASASKTVWHIGYQDVIAIGKLFTTGKLYTQRTLAFAGPTVKQPRLLVTNRGADLTELVNPHDLQITINRVISGSVLSGRKAEGSLGYLGRYHNQVSVLEEGDERPFMHFLQTGGNRFSKLPIYISQFFKNKRFNFTSSTNGSPRGMVPIGLYEKVMPLDILPTQLLRALIVEDIETAVGLGALELDEEDVALCTFVCPGKYEYGDILRDNLTRIEQEG